MARRRNRDGDRSEALIKLVVGGIILICFAFGGLSGFANVTRVVFLSLLFGVIGCAVLVVVFAAVKLVRKRFTSALSPNTEKPNAPTPKRAWTTEPEVAEAPTPRHVWTEARIAERLQKIDWYQFEKLNAEILRSEGWTVERKGGASPDGGVDLIATKGEEKILIQCKHWRSWNVQEKVIREMLGSMTHFGVSTGAIHTLKGWTAPAARFAQEHNIELCDSANLIRRAGLCLSNEDLDQCLLDETHYCPKCEAKMIWKTGNFEPFWGCSRFPRCRSIIRETAGAQG